MVLVHQVYVDPKHGIVSSGRGPTLEEAKAKFLTSWQNATRLRLARCPELRLAALLFRWGVVLPLLQDLAATSLNPIHLIGKGKPSLREQRKTFLQGCFAG